MSRTSFMMLTGILFLALSATGCSRQGETQEKSSSRPPVSVEVMKPLIGDLSESVEVVGTLSAKFQADLRSEYPGIVSHVYVTEWVSVKKGDPLLRLDTREAELIVQKSQAAVDAAHAQLLQAEVALRRAERECSRLMNLKEHGLVTQQALDDMLTEKEAALARVTAAKAQLKAAQDELVHTRTRLSKTIISAPMDGVVAMRDVNVGNMVEAGGLKVLFRIVDNRLLDLTMTVPSKHMRSIKVGQPIVFTTDAFPGETFTGHIKFINPTVNETDRSVKVIAEVKNQPERLKAGLFVKGSILTAQRKGVLQIPRAALVTWNIENETAEVYTVENEIAGRRKVKTGSVSSDGVEIIQGINPEDMLITRGGFNVKDGDRVRVIEVRGGH